jgi:hypothetical protein
MKACRITVFASTLVRIVIAALLAMSLGLASAQEIVNDPDVDMSVLQPAFPQDSGPIVAVDSGHNNYHTIEGRYEPFALLLRNDGFHVIDLKSSFTTKALSSIKVLVISNALPLALVKDWTLPASSAFSQAEVDAVKSWVVGGGSLLLIADHQPFAGSARALALTFGFQFEDGAVLRERGDRRPDIFTVADGTLKSGEITRGRNPAEAVTAVRTFTGSAFQAPPTARPIIVIPSGFKIHQCGLPCPAGVPERDAAGYLQGAVLPFGKGRVAVFGEAAMFSAQVIPSLKPPFRFGFGATGAEQNKQFVLNLVRWLAGILPDGSVRQ